MKKIVTSHWLTLLFLCILCFWTSIGVFWNLGKSSLQPWDEAWYGAISQEMIQHGQPFHLLYNQQTFFDHPPLGFQLKALSMLLFGNAAFSVRLPEALLAIISVVLVFETSRRLSSPWAGFWSGLVLLSSRWFLFRARTGNLDILLLTTQLLVIYAAVMALFGPTRTLVKHTGFSLAAVLNTHKWLALLWFFLGISLLSKSLISLQLLPLVVVVTGIYCYQQWPLIAAKKRVSTICTLAVLCLLSFTLPLVPWILTYLQIDAQKFWHQQLRIGFREGTDKGVELAYISTFMQYFHAAVHRWFKFIALAGIGSIGLLVFKTTRNKVLLMLLYGALVAAPYMISEKTEIWHLIPLIGVAAIFTGTVFDLGIHTSIACIKKLRRHWHVSAYPFQLAVSGIFIAIACISYIEYQKEFLGFVSPPQDYEKITWHIPDRSTTLYVTSDAYFPSFVYYAGLHDAQVVYLSDSEFATTCQRMAGSTFQAVARYGDWLMKYAGEQAVIAREGELVMMNIASTDCHYTTQSTPPTKLLQAQ